MLRHPSWVPSYSLARRFVDPPPSVMALQVPDCPTCHVPPLQRYEFLTRYFVAGNLPHGSYESFHPFAPVHMASKGSHPLTHISSVCAFPPLIFPSIVLCMFEQGVFPRLVLLLRVTFSPMLQSLDVFYCSRVRVLLKCQWALPCRDHNSFALLLLSVSAPFARHGAFFFSLIEPRIEFSFTIFSVSFLHL